MGEPIIRLATDADLGAINDIYNHYIRETAITFDIDEWDMARRAEWFASFADSGRHQLFVADDEGAVTGFAGTRPFRTKAAYETTTETTIYLVPGCERRGTGRALYTRLFEAMAAEDVHLLVAGITLPNAASVGLHEAMGFTCTGIFPQVGRKFGRYWDVAWFHRPNGPR
jgi:phosphinothricin acetyltransferase